ncbi:hypothetical protein [Acidipropionibacterium jensenii]|uniref:hypothetical protein n=1 Tax=Acidipropionibacterium jensenii TaxID=1749 RepID=UPI00214C1FB7|nr:hypothetical protein [Acidipropionibacterium jensenii]
MTCRRIIITAQQSWDDTARAIATSGKLPALFDAMVATDFSEMNDLMRTVLTVVDENHDQMASVELHTHTDSVLVITPAALRDDAVHPLTMFGGAQQLTMRPGPDPDAMAQALRTALLSSARQISWSPRNGEPAVVLPFSPVVTESQDPDLHTYQVTWSIDTEAVSPQAAAKDIWNTYFAEGVDPDEQPSADSACVFDVSDEHSGGSVRIDLGSPRHAGLFASSPYARRRGLSNE